MNTLSVPYSTLPCVGHIEYRLDDLDHRSRQLGEIHHTRMNSNTLEPVSKLSNSQKSHDRQRQNETRL